VALLGALCVWLNALGFTNRSLRAQVDQLLGVPPADYTVNQMSYDPGPAPDEGTDPPASRHQHLRPHR
jgi:hypothetical protein